MTDAEMTDAQKFGAWVMRCFGSWDAYNASLPSSHWFKIPHLPDPDLAWQPTDETEWVSRIR